MSFLGRKADSKPQYRVLVGLNWSGERAEPGEVRDDIPEQSVGWLMEQGCIEPAEGEAD